MSEFISVVEVASLPPGNGRSVHLKGQTYALYNVEGQFYALDDLCPHAGAPLGAGFCEGEQVFCPMHGWAFDVKTGACKTNPLKPVKTYPTRVVDGWVQISL